MLKATEILQIDATIIAGILVLLTLVFIDNGALLQQKTEKMPIETFTETPVAWLYLIGLFFSVSAFLALIMSFIEDKNSNAIPFVRGGSYAMMLSGFGLFIFGFFSLGIIFD